MEIETIDLSEIDLIHDTVVVIDVLRAFTTSAFAFKAGAQSIQLVRTVEEALTIRQAQPDVLIMGEVNGLRPEGFDFGNSPTALINQNLSGYRLVQRTGAGTQGAVRCAQARHLLAGSFVCAKATVRYLQRIQPDAITLVVTGAHTPDKGEDDRACADYLTALLNGMNPPFEQYRQRVLSSDSGRLFSGQPGMEFDRQDLENALNIDCFPFAMVTIFQENQLFLRPHWF